jgi:homoserine kinase type II
MDSVWLLWFEQDRSDSEDIELLIGVYRTEESAKAAIERVRDQPGFKDYAKGLTAHEYVLDRDHWTKGFVRSKSAIENRPLG